MTTTMAPQGDPRQTGVTAEPIDKLPTDNLLHSPETRHASPVAGLIQGGLGGPADELLESGQEEVFSRTEVELGRIEHSAGTDEAATSEATRLNAIRTEAEEG